VVSTRGSGAGPEVVEVNDAGPQMLVDAGTGSGVRTDDPQDGGGALTTEMKRCPIDPDEELSFNIFLACRYELDIAKCPLFPPPDGTECSVGRVECIFCSSPDGKAVAVDRWGCDEGKWHLLNPSNPCARR